jgi:hypothetical protein
VNFSGSTPCMPKICMLALENPHCGVSGVPFMKSTTGDEAMALSIAERTSSESRRAWKGVRKRAVGIGRAVLARDAARKAWEMLVFLSYLTCSFERRTEGIARLANIMCGWNVLTKSWWCDHLRCSPHPKFWMRSECQD